MPDFVGTKPYTLPLPGAVREWDREKGGETRRR